MTEGLFWALFLAFGAIMSVALIVEAVKQDAERTRKRKSIIGVDLAKPGSDRAVVTMLSGPGAYDVIYDGPNQRQMAPMQASMQAQMMAEMDKIMNPPIMSQAWTASEIAAPQQQAAQQYAAMVNSRHGGKSYLAGLHAQGLLGGIGMPGMAPSMAAPLPPGLADPGAGVGSAPPPKEAPTAVVPNLLAGMNKEEVGRFIDSVRAQRAKAPEDKRANYDAMIEAGEKRLAEISESNAVTTKTIMHAMDALAKNGSSIVDPITAAGVIGDIMKDLI